MESCHSGCGISSEWLTPVRSLFRQI